ncbi:unnamed protein product [Diplocarpon coronariae]|nr:hypothetical protein JHW43_005725 [Diplocarpon mali]
MALFRVLVISRSETLASVKPSQVKTLQAPLSPTDGFPRRVPTRWLVPGTSENLSAPSRRRRRRRGPEGWGGQSTGKQDAPTGTSEKTRCRGFGSPPESPPLHLVLWRGSGDARLAAAGLIPLAPPAPSLILWPPLDC